jgi:guanylate kinase
MHKGKLVLVVGPTGSGKGTLIEHIQKLYPEIIFPVACTTRAMRPGDVEGREFFFVTKEEFERRIAIGDFLEWAQYGGNYYGSPKDGVLPYLAEGKILVDELDVQGARQVKAIIPSDQLATIFIDAGLWDDLQRRVRARAPITEAELEKRKQRYEDEMSFKDEATYVVKNPEGEIEQAKQDLAKIVESLLVS